MGNQLSGVLRDDDLEVTVKLVIRKRNRKAAQQQQENSVPSEEDDQSGDANTEATGGEEDEEEYEMDDQEEQEDVLEDGEAVVKVKRRGRPPGAKSVVKHQRQHRDDESVEDDFITPVRKKQKSGAGRPSSVRIRSNSDHPILDIRVTKTHLSPSFCLNVPPEFANAHLDVNTEYAVVNGGSCKTLSLYMKNKRCVFKRSQWKLFVEEQKLKSGDTVHLELLENDQIRLEVSKGDDLDDSDEQQLVTTPGEPEMGVENSLVAVPSVEQDDLNLNGALLAIEAKPPEGSDACETNASGVAEFCVQ